MLLELLVTQIEHQSNNCQHDFGKQLRVNDTGKLPVMVQDNDRQNKERHVAQDGDDQRAQSFAKRLEIACHHVDDADHWR